MKSKNMLIFCCWDTTSKGPVIHMPWDIHGRQIVESHFSGPLLGRWLGSFHPSWGCPKIDGLQWKIPPKYHGTSIYEWMIYGQSIYTWMMTGGAPISGSLHLLLVNGWEWGKLENKTETESSTGSTIDGFVSSANNASTFWNPFGISDFHTWIMITC